MRKCILLLIITSILWLVSCEYGGAPTPLFPRVLNYTDRSFKINDTSFHVKIIKYDSSGLGAGNFDSLESFLEDRFSKMSSTSVKISVPKKIVIWSNDSASAEYYDGRNSIFTVNRNNHYIEFLNDQDTISGYSDLRGSYEYIGFYQTGSYIVWTIYNDTSSVTEILFGSLNVPKLLDSIGTSEVYVRPIVNSYETWRPD